MDKGIDGRSGKEFIRQTRDQFGNQDGLCREHQIAVQAAFGVQTDKFDCTGVGNLGSSAAGRGNRVDVINTGRRFRTEE